MVEANVNIDRRFPHEADRLLQAPPEPLCPNPPQLQIEKRKFASFLHIRKPEEECRVLDAIRHEVNRGHRIQAVESPERRCDQEQITNPAHLEGDNPANGSRIGWSRRPSRPLRYS